VGAATTTPVTSSPALLSADTRADASLPSDVTLAMSAAGSLVVSTSNATVTAGSSPPPICRLCRRLAALCASVTPVTRTAEASTDSDAAKAPANSSCCAAPKLAASRPPSVTEEETTNVVPAVYGGGSGGGASVTGPMSGGLGACGDGIVQLPMVPVTAVPLHASNAGGGASVNGGGRSNGRNKGGGGGDAACAPYVSAYSVTMHDNNTRAAVMSRQSHGITLGLKNAARYPAQLY
jgi:hypothetical protein